MTTRITVDAHAGWPVKVSAFNKGRLDPATGNRQPDSLRSVVTVPPHQTHDIHCWDDCYLVIEELPQEVQTQAHDPADPIPKTGVDAAGRPHHDTRENGSYKTSA